MPEQPKQASKQPTGEINLDQDGAVILVTEGPLSEQVITHLGNMLREWRAAGQTFRISLASSTLRKESKG